jgi:polyisoprenoid-binding protein YceI
MKKLLSISLFGLLATILISGCHIQTAEERQAQIPPEMPAIQLDAQNTNSQTDTETPTPEDTAADNTIVENTADETAATDNTIQQETQTPVATEPATQTPVTPESPNQNTETQASAPTSTPETVIPETPETSTQSNLIETVDINTQISLVEWLGEKIVGASHPGSFNLASGQLELDNKKITTGQFKVDINSLKSYQGLGSLESHLLSADFFNAGAHPTANFTITQSSYQGPTQLNITGQMTIKGITHTENLSAIHNPDTQQITAQMNLDRTKYDITYDSGQFFKDLADAAIKDIIPLDIKLNY